MHEIQDNYFELTTDLNFTEVEFYPQMISGIFNGRSHRIYNISIAEPLLKSGELHYGVFAPICGSLQIINLVVDNISLQVKSFQEPTDS